MKFSFKGNIVKDLSFKENLSNENIQKDKMKFDYELSFDKKDFFADLELDIKTKSGYIIKLLYRSIFQFKEELDKNFLEDKEKDAVFLTIAYPYLRAYITNLTVSSGIDPIIIGNINFFSFCEKKHEKNKKSEEKS